MATLNADGTPKSVYQLAAEEIARQNTITPTLNTFNEANSTAGRVASIIDGNSPLMQQAATKGTQLAAQRGLTNSTLAAEASQQAVLGAATPIAQTDASLFQQAMLANQAASNSASTVNAQLGTQTGLAGIQAGQQQQQIDAQISQFAQSLGMNQQELALRRDQLTEQQKQAYDQLNLQKQQLTQNQTQFDATLGANQGNFATEQANKLMMQQLDLQARERMVQIQADAQGMGGSIAGAYGNLQTNITAIQNNPNLDAEAKATLINNNIASFQAFANFWKKTSSPTADISDLLAFGPAPVVQAGSAPADAPPPPPGSTTSTPWGNVYGGIPSYSPSSDGP